MPAFDGVPIDVNVALPDEADFGPGPYPLMMMFHGYGGGKIGLGSMQHWLDRGYATFSMTDRGFRESCGSAASQVAPAARCRRQCADGYVRLIDNRYEVRDAQEFAGQLADENLIDPQRIGAIGGSYGGGMSMALGALKNRKVLPDYSLVPWTSPDGKPMQIAAAAPNIPWTDLAYSLQPNGSTLDYVADAPYKGRVGVEKQSLVGGLYFSGLGAPGYLRAGRHRPDCGHHRLAHPAGARRALRRERPADRRRDHPAPLLVLHRSLDRPGADADVERVHRRPLPGRRDDPLLQPHPDPVRRQPPGAVLRRFRSPAVAEQGAT